MCFTDLGGALFWGGFVVVVVVFLKTNNIAQAGLELLVNGLSLPSAQILSTRD